MLHSQKFAHTLQIWRYGFKASMLTPADLRVMHASVRSKLFKAHSFAQASVSQSNSNGCGLGWCDSIAHCANYVQNVIISEEELMTVYVDNERIPWRGKLWCHLVADSLAELHQFASRLGLKHDWFQDKASYPHYDVTMSVRERALTLGALPARKRQMIASAKLLRDELRTPQENREIFLAKSSLVEIV